MQKRILVLCTGNSARSQMAKGLLKSFDSSLQIFSAGTNPAEHVNPFAIKVMREIGIDISQHRPKSVTQFLNLPLTTLLLFVITRKKPVRYLWGRSSTDFISALKIWQRNTEAMMKSFQCSGISEMKSRRHFFSFILTPSHRDSHNG